MTDTDRSHRPFRLADLLLLTVGVGIGFALFSVIRAEAIRHGELELPEDVGSHTLYNAGPIELLFTALSLGVAVAFPLVRLREAWLEPKSRRPRVTDAIGMPPMILLSLSALHAARQPSLDPAWLIVPAMIAFLLFALAMLFWIPITVWFLSQLPTPTNWIEYLGLAATFMNGLVLLHAFAR